MLASHEPPVLEVGAVLLRERCTLKDGQNSVRKVVDTTGTVVASYDYDAWGNILGQDQPSGWIFNHRAFGEVLDPNLGMTYLRARWMDPQAGRFGSRDPFSGVEWDPQSLHRFTYSYQDPINKSDPSGAVTLLEALETVGVLAVLGAVESAAFVRPTNSVWANLGIGLGLGVVTGVFAVVVASLAAESSVLALADIEFVAFPKFTLRGVQGVLGGLDSLISYYSTTDDPNETTGGKVAAFVSGFTIGWLAGNIPTPGKTGLVLAGISQGLAMTSGCGITMVEGFLREHGYYGTPADAFEKIAAGIRSQNNAVLMGAS